MEETKKFDLSQLIVSVTEWISNLAVLNLYWLLFSLPIITLIPATDTLFSIISNQEISEVEESLFVQFRHQFKDNFRGSYKKTFPLVMISIIYLINFTILQSVTSLPVWMEIIKYAFYTLGGILLLVSLLGYSFSQMKNVRLYKSFLISLALVGKYPLILIAYIVSLIIIFFVLLRWPALLIFFCMSSVVWLSSKVISLAIEKETQTK